MIMEFLDRFFNLKIAVVDLAKKETEILPLPRDVAVENLGGASLNCALFKQYREDDPLVLGVGPLTGSFAPGSCLMVATFRRFSDDGLCHTPLMLRAGPGLKFSGLDFLVIKGSATAPQKLVIAINTIQFLPAEDLINRSVPEVSEMIKLQHPARRYFTILTGPAADTGSPNAMVSLGTGGSLDKGGMAAWMAARKLKAIMFAGGGGLPFGANNLSLRGKMLNTLNAGRKTKGGGCLSVLGSIGLPEAVKSYIANSIKSVFACYNCPFPCMGYGVTPGLNRSGGKGSEPVMVIDHSGLTALAKTCGRQCLVLLGECQRLGLDPVAAALKLDPEMKIEELVQTARGLAGIGKDRQILSPGVDETSAFIRGDVPAEDFLKFGGGLPPILSGRIEKNPRLWTDRVAMTMILGVCPIIALRFPEISSKALLEFISDDQAEREFLKQRLSASVQSL